MKAYNPEISCYTIKTIDLTPFMTVVRSNPRFQIAVVTARPPVGDHV